MEKEKTSRVVGRPSFLGVERGLGHTAISIFFNFVIIFRKYSLIILYYIFPLH
jgi:hypothetical protein